MKYISLSSFFLLLAITAISQNVYPTHWWVGMKESRLQLMIHNETDIAVDKLVFRSSSADVKIEKVNKTDNKHYLFVDVIIAKNAKPQKVTFSFGGVVRSEWKSIQYELKARSKENGKSRVKGVTASDFVYLMIPDRFANGDPSNDIIPDYREQANDRKNMFTRHGGDFKGITDHLDYFDQLGVTTIWMTPVIENNTSLMHEWGNTIAGYHGYWFTDHYQVDKRLGGNEGYKKFCDDLHKRGMKVIQDAVYNHVSKENWFILDPPMKDWINNWPVFTSPNHREEVLFDLYASQHDKKNMLDGWFTDHLPDLNQRNPFVAKFLIQHAIWTTEEYGIDGWRVDTYKYCDEKFLNDINIALEKEFPTITVFGEAWVNSITGNAYFTENNLKTGFHHNAQGVIDFQTCFAMLAGMNEKYGWTNGVNKIYMTMAQDLLYKNPYNNCIFLDNHDMDRVFSVVDEDWKKMKMGFNWLLTLRGIPQIYYGAEVLMKNKKTTTDATVREDFPGGWSGDASNRFLKSGRNEAQNASFEHVSALGRYRRTSSALSTGKMMQFVPKDSVFTYFRYDNKQTVMVMTNTANSSKKPDWISFKERIGTFTHLKDIITGQRLPINEFVIDPMDSRVFELSN